jgi:hypothetical protein
MRVQPIAALLCLGLTAAAVAGCAAVGQPGSTAANSPASGYAYSDANHPNGLVQPSPEAEANAARSVNLWPPSLNGGDLR